MNNATHIRDVEECVAFLHRILPSRPQTIVQLGTGLGGFAEKLTPEISIPYAEIPHFPISTVTSHSGNLIFGHIGDHAVAVLQGRVHYYEGYSTREVAFPVRTLSLLGAENLIITNAAGGLNPLFTAGSIMIIRDHLNFLGENPLRGPNHDSWGPRFPDLSKAYDPGLIKTALDSAYRSNLKNVITGVYACIPGPSLETAAETSWLRQSGADAVGMSSVPEVLVAIHAGLRVLGLSVIANVNNPEALEPILIEDIIATAGRVEPELEKLIFDILSNI